MEHWRQALTVMVRNCRTGVNYGELLDRRPKRTIEHAGPALRPEIDKLLRTYVRRNGSYRIEPFLAFDRKVRRTPAEGARWIIDSARPPAEPSQFLAWCLVKELGKSPAEREILFANMLEQARREAERRAGDARSDARWRLQDFQMRYLRSLLATKQYTEAAEVVRSIPAGYAGIDARQPDSG